MQRIEDGSYGYCEDTGEPIGIKRLEARPIATLSIEAQERHEKMEKTQIDNDALNNIAEITGGKYYRAESANALKNIYEEIDQLEKTELASLKYYKKTELFLPFVLLGALLLGIAKTLELTLFKTIE